MRNGASDLLFNYRGSDRFDFDELMGFFEEQVREELQPLPDNTGDEFDEEFKRLNAQLSESAKGIQEAAKVALEIYDRHMLRDADVDNWKENAIKEMKQYEGNEWLPIIGECLENNDYSKLAI